MAVTPAQIAQLARSYGLDPQAVLQVASVEGLGGGVGDQGTSFGPFQLHRGGALPATVPLQQAQQWAWSPAGITYALQGIAKVARGLTGAQAVSAIVRGFERPADPAGEVSRALGSSYGAATLPAAQASPAPALPLPAAQPAIDPGLIALLLQHTQTPAASSLGQPITRPPAAPALPDFFTPLAQSQARTAATGQFQLRPQPALPGALR